MASRSSVAIVGGAGALGSALVSAYARAGWHAVSIDFTSNGAAHESILLDASAEPSARVADMIGKASTSSVPAEGSGFSAVINAAGSWAGGGVEDADLMDSVENMWGANLVPSVGAAQLASRYLTADGLLVLTGAQAAMRGTPGMLGYGMSKAATHHLIKSLAEPEEVGGLGQQRTVLGFLPVTIDTPNNRKFMPDADVSEWTSCEEISAKLLGWSSSGEAGGGSSCRPASGTLVAAITKGGRTTFVETDKMCGY